LFDNHSKKYERPNKPLHDFFLLNIAIFIWRNVHHLCMDL
jgi:hypothetical protein